MAGPSPRKNKAPEDAEPPSPSKRIKKTPSADRSSTSTAATEELNNEGLGSPPTNPAPAPRLAQGASTEHDNGKLSTDTNARTLPAEDDLQRSPTLEIPDYVDESVIPRLERLHMFREPRFNRYGIGYLPNDANWGESPDGRFAPYEHLLCYDGKPLVALMVGIARKVQLRSDDKFSLGLQLLCEHDVNAARYNAYTRCEPAQVPTEAATLTFANKFISKKRHEEQEFDEVYDGANHDMRGWDAAHKMSADRINFADVVLVEFYIRRFKNKKTATTGKRWSAWGVAFDLLRVALLAEGEAPVNEPPPDSAAVF